MYTYVYICIYMRMYVHAYMYLYELTCMYICIYTWTYMHILIYVNIHIHDRFFRSNGIVVEASNTVNASANFNVLNAEVCICKYYI
jgi:hypothetical protein